MGADSDRAVFITLFCKNCNEPRYRSVKALRLGIDKAEAHLFQPAGPGIPQPDPSGPMACPFCTGPLMTLKEQPQVAPKAPDSNQMRLDAMAAERAAEEIRRAQNEYSKPMPAPTPVVEAAGPSIVSSWTGVTEVFRLESGEEMVSVQDLPSKILLVTSKRVVTVSK